MSECHEGNLDLSSHWKMTWRQWKYWEWSTRFIIYDWVTKYSTPMKRLLLCSCLNCLIRQLKINSL
uniref:Uncharacterized protein n=1 Tax=Octopus bimaculoides TaxID=37653 RepID=A0A0L8IDC9_OCTBM